MTESHLNIKIFEVRFPTSFPPPAPQCFISFCSCHPLILIWTFGELIVSINMEQYKKTNHAKHNWEKSSDFQCKDKFVPFCVT